MGHSECCHVRTLLYFPPQFPTCKIHPWWTYQLRLYAMSCKVMLDWDRILQSHLQNSKWGYLNDGNTSGPHDTWPSTATLFLYIKLMSCPAKVRAVGSISFLHQWLFHSHAHPASSGIENVPKGWIDQVILSASCMNWSFQKNKIKTNSHTYVGLTN